MGANVAHGRDRTLRCFADEDREAQQDGPFQATGSEFTAQAGGIPKAEQRGTLRWLNFGNEVAIHGKRREVRERTSPDLVNIASGSWNVKPTGAELPSLVRIWREGGILSGGGVGSIQIVLLARRTRTMKLCSSDARSKGQSGYSPNGWMELKS